MRAINALCKTGATHVNRQTAVDDVKMSAAAKMFRFLGDRNCTPTFVPPGTER